MENEVINSVGFWVFLTVGFALVILDAALIKRKKEEAWIQEVMKEVRTSHPSMLFQKPATTTTTRPE